MTRSILPGGTLALLVAAGPAAAHHPTGGTPPSGVLDGLLSGLAHPLLGLDHAVLLVALALAALRERRVIGHAVTYVVAAAVGAALCARFGQAPGIGYAVAATLAGAAALLAAGPRQGRGAMVVAVAVAGVVHGHALGESIVGADGATVLPYLVGLVAVQLGIVLAIGAAATRLTVPARRVAMRATAIACGAGALLAGGLA
jgi:urease accessory protein